MPPKVSRVSSKPTKTITKASTSSSSKSSGSSKTSSSSSVRKSTTATTSSRPAPAPKPRNVDKVEFGNTRTVADAGVYHRPKPIAAATGRDPEPPKPKKTEPPRPLTLKDFTEEEHKKKIKEAEKKHPAIMEAYKYLEKKQEDTKKFAESPAGHAIGKIGTIMATSRVSKAAAVFEVTDSFVSETKGEKSIMTKAEEAIATAVYTAGRTVVDIGSAILKGGAIVNGVYPKEDSDSSSSEGE